MRILYDARSVRTPAGRYIFQGLTGAWAADARVQRVYAAIPPDFDRSLLPPGVEPVEVRSRSWLSHVNRIRRAADRERVDVIFAPNAIAPRDARSVLYFQDLFHFRPRPAQPHRVSRPLHRPLRAAWRRLTSSRSLLAVAVSREILSEVEPRMRVPTVLIPNGVDVGENRWRGDAASVLVAGGIGVRKDEATAVRAWAAIPSARRRGLVLEVVGVEPAVRKSSLIGLARSLGIDDSVAITSGVSRTAYLERMARAKLVISCSQLEAFGLPVAEALAMGAPLICSDAPAHLELLERAGAGASFATGAADDLARHIERSLCVELPPRLAHSPPGWSWTARAREHIDHYLARA